MLVHARLIPVISLIFLIVASLVILQYSLPHSWDQFFLFLPSMQLYLLS